MSNDECSSLDMPLAGLVDLFVHTPTGQHIITTLDEHPLRMDLHGPSCCWSLISGAISQHYPLLVVTPTTHQACDLVEELREIIGDQVGLFPSWEVLPHERLSPGIDTMGARLTLLRRLAYPADERLGPPIRIIVTTVRSFIQPLIPDLDKIEPLILIPGQHSDFDHVITTLVQLGYVRADMVTKRGEFAVRGGIIDVFPPTADHPMRVEFWGDDISDIRFFAVADQRSITEVPARQLVAGACRELLLTPQVRKRASELLAEHPHHSTSITGDITEILEKISDGIPVEGMEALLPVLYPHPLTLLTHYCQDRALLICDPERVRARAADLINTGREFLEASWSLAALGSHSPIDVGDLTQSGFRSYDSVIQDWAAKQRPYWTISQLPSSEAIDLGIRPCPITRGIQRNIDELLAMLSAHVSMGGHGAIVVPGLGTARRIVEQLHEAMIPVALVEQHRWSSSGVVEVICARLHQGMILDQAQLVVITEADLTGNRSIGTSSQPMAPKRRNVVDPLALHAGDLVVHEQHGIGKFIEITERLVSGARREYVVLEYASAKRGGGADKLYVPMDSLHQLSRYVGGQNPGLNKLGGSDWANTKTKARKAVADIASDLVALYAKRQASPGYAFSPDTPWQAEMEDAFGFVETADQLTAIREVKADMEKPIPMDRVICGDVGYGKTEIAVRAAFKAVQDNKQVALLVPTTLLVDQHYQTFTRRMAGFPVCIKALSRFTSPEESRQIIAGLADGSVDIVIGTHRLLQTGVNWKQLGLVIVDEEQRFGVEHKEHIKSLRTHVDVLTMSATPIPRTLEMSLAGIREMSTILTPPEERHAVLTYVGPHDHKQIAAALRRELLRDGQVFYVHNRVSTIDAAAARIKELVPEARVMIAHGQMPEEQLESTVQKFWNREFDILVCTTIIETGLDISNANTLIVERADSFGLSQLHQLRGRVGRSRERGYAYFFYPPDTPLTETAHERLVTIAQNNELGAGMAVAMKDLELRGAGNVLGVEQSGHVAGVGFDLYMSLVGEAINAYKAAVDGTPIKADNTHEITMDLPVDAHFPASYIPSDRLRLEAYRRLAAAENENAIAGILEELVDRYGPLPEVAIRLVALTRLRLLCRLVGIQEITTTGPTVRIKPLALADSAQMRLKRLSPGARYRPTTATVQLPIPRVSSHLGAEHLRDQQLIDLIVKLICALTDTPIPQGLITSQPTAVQSP